MKCRDPCRLLSHQTTRWRPLGRTRYFLQRNTGLGRYYSPTWCILHARIFVLVSLYGNVSAERWNLTDMSSNLTATNSCCDLLPFLGGKINNTIIWYIIISSVLLFPLDYCFFFSQDLPAGWDLRGSTVVRSQVALWPSSPEADRLCMWRPSVSSAAAVVFRTSASACLKFWFDVSRALLQRHGKMWPSCQSVDERGEISDDACN